MSNIDLLAPKITTEPASLLVFSKSSVADVIQALLKQRCVLLDTSFFDGLSILEELDQHLPAPHPKASFTKRSVHRKKFRQVSQCLLVSIRNRNVQLDGVSIEAILETLYPEKASGCLSFVNIQELAGANKRMEQGVHYPVLGNKIHPFFGVYFPTRTEHLELFATWLSQYSGPKEHAIDVGTGSGILSFLLLKSGFEQVTATDQNPNAIWSAHQDAERLQWSERLQTLHTDLLEGTSKTSLIVFNPPWIPGESDSSVNDALFYDDGLFTRFFDQAHQKLEKDGRLVLLFSTILTLLRPDLPHPIERELSKNRFHLVQKTKRKVKPTNGRRTKERVEIWELTHKELPHKD